MIVLIIYELYFPVKHNNIPINSLTFHCEMCVNWYIVAFDRKIKLIYSTNNTQQDGFLKDSFDNGVSNLVLLVLWISSIVRYSKSWKTNYLELQLLPTSGQWCQLSWARQKQLLLITVPVSRHHSPEDGSRYNP
jgi:hypothetical protein